MTVLEIHLDPVGGIAGDMFVAALLDLRPALNTGLQAALKRCPLIEDVECKLVAHHDGVLTGSRFKVHHTEHGSDHPHDHHQHYFEFQLVKQGRQIHFMGGATYRTRAP